MSESERIAGRILDECFADYAAAFWFDRHAAASVIKSEFSSLRATLAARESELAEAKRRVAELEANLDAGRELMRVAWREFNAIRARDGAPAGICHDYWSEMTEELRELLGDDATPWMTRAARALVQPYESRVGRLTSELVDMELRAIAAENKLADRITHIPGKESDDGEMH